MVCQVCSNEQPLGTNVSLIDFPGAMHTIPVAINNKGQILGNYYDDYDYKTNYGFLKNGDIYTKIEYPGHPLLGGILTGINDSGQIVGYYFDPVIWNYVSFITDGINFTNIIPPEGWYRIQARGINNSGQIVGSAIMNDGKWRAFLATPTPSNTPPILQPIGDKTVSEGQPLVFSLGATDPDGNSLTYSASNLPSGATFDPATQTFSWSPTFDQAGTYPNILFTVTDNGIPPLSAQESISITVLDKWSDSGGCVTLLDHNGNGLTGGKVRYACGGSWQPEIPGATGSDGRLCFEVSCPNLSKVKMTYNQGSIEQTEAQLTASNATWQTVEATVKLKDSNGYGIGGGKVDQGGGMWVHHGYTDANGEFKLEMFADKSYKFRMTYNFGSNEITQNVSNPFVFQTGAVYSNSGAATQYARGSWQTFVQNIELLSGNWQFRFNDGTPITNYIIGAGIVNSIH